MTSRLRWLSTRKPSSYAPTSPRAHSSLMFSNWSTSSTTNWVSSSLRGSPKSKSLISTSILRKALRRKRCIGKSPNTRRRSMIMLKKGIIRKLKSSIKKTRIKEKPKYLKNLSIIFSYQKISLQSWVYHSYTNCPSFNYSWRSVLPSSE